MLPALLFTACRDDMKWTGTVQLPSDGWTDGMPVVFDLDPQAYLAPESNRFAEMTSRAIGDTLPRLSGHYNARLSLRYADGCNARDIRIATELASLDRDITTDTISVTLFNSDGTPVSPGRYGINEVAVPLPAGLTVTQGTTLTLTPISYSSPIEGMLSVSLILSE
ncbi:MAG: gliding motility lipoprotein GldH [Muribaculaceae bacterium]|nr:gliding motility lipoprotein GldH [Muribaculaceae bacterium]MDE7081167.1 gliding motility lipoprotein GldH [Muribaculaceae bacterium]